MSYYSSFCFDKFTLIKQINAPAAKIINCYSNLFDGKINHPVTAKMNLVSGFKSKEEHALETFLRSSKLNLSYYDITQKVIAHSFARNFVIFEVMDCDSLLL